jgi:hypothetical protein
MEDGWRSVEPIPAVPGKTRVVVVDVPQRHVVSELETDVDVTDGWAPVYFARRDQLLLTTRSRTQRTGVWDTSNWQRVKVLEGPPTDDKPVVALSSDGKTFAVSGLGGQLHLWDLERLAALEPINLGTGTFIRWPSIPMAGSSRRGRLTARLDSGVSPPARRSAPCAGTVASSVASSSRRIAASLHPVRLTQRFGSGARARGMKLKLLNAPRPLRCLVPLSVEPFWT